MESPLQITCRGFAHQAALDQFIHNRVHDLERVAGQRLTACHVVVELGHEHAPGARMFHVRVDVAYSGGVTVVDRDARPDHAHENPRFAVHAAFDAVERKIEQNGDRRHGS